MKFNDTPIPAQAGVGLKPQHYDDIIGNDNQDGRTVAWFEVHPENYFAQGGLSHKALSAIRADYPLSMHGIGMSLGSEDGLDINHLQSIKTLVERYQPGLFSEHLSWSRYQQFYSNDLLPIPYTEEAMNVFKDNINQVQDTLGRQILVENPSSYFMLQQNDYTEWDFLVTLCKQTGAGILLDVNNVYVSAINHGFDAEHYLHAIPAEMIGEIHLAGHATEEHAFGQLLIDDHGSEVKQDVWDLYSTLIGSVGAKPTLIEWDTNIPEWATLVAEAKQAESKLLSLEEALA